MDAKRIIGFVAGLIALGLQLPGILMVLKNPGEWSFAIILLAVLMLAAVVFTIISAIFSITGHKKVSAMFICAGIGEALTLALTFYLLLSFEFTVIAAALSAIILFVSAKLVSPARG